MKITCSKNNVFYKLISKILANQLKMVLHEIISPNQSAFIPGHLIMDNVLAAYETLHTMHSKIFGKVGYMAVKLDMSMPMPGWNGVFCKLLWTA